MYGKTTVSEHRQFYQRGSVASYVSAGIATAEMPVCPPSVRLSDTQSAFRPMVDILSIWCELEGRA